MVSFFLCLQNFIDHYPSQSGQYFLIFGSISCLGLVLMVALHYHDIHHFHYIPSDMILRRPLSLSAIRLSPALRYSYMRSVTLQYILRGDTLHINITDTPATKAAANRHTSLRERSKSVLQPHKMIVEFAVTSQETNSSFNQ